MRALITGGGRGIGAEIARALARDGWQVVVGARSRDQVEAVADEIDGEWVKLDVAEPHSVDRAVGQVGQIDLLVANAGAGAVGGAVRFCGLGGSVVFRGGHRIPGRGAAGVGSAA